MHFDREGRIVWTPRDLFQMALDHPRRLVDGYLMTGTPWAFDRYADYCAFVEAVSDRTGVHPKNLYLRGSCQVGFSIAPRNDKVWTQMSDRSDLDLVIVDAHYFERIEREVQRWEDRNRAEFLQGRASRAFFERQRDRQFNCCRDEGLPTAVCVHHQDTMRQVAAMAHCGRPRPLSAFIYPDWYSARQRYDYDLRELRAGVQAGRLTPPGDAPLPAESRQTVPAGAEPPAPRRPEGAADPRAGPSAITSPAQERCATCGGALLPSPLGFRPA